MPSTVMDWLAAGLPLALLVDIALPGPDSLTIAQREGGVADWLRQTA